MNKEVYELACSYKRCFTETTDGKAVLEDMKKGYCHHTTFHVEPVAMDMASKPIEDILDEEDEHDGGRTNTGNIDTSGGHYL